MSWHFTRETACRPTVVSRVAVNLTIDEAALTGESAPIDKTDAELSEPTDSPSPIGETWHTQGPS